MPLHFPSAVVPAMASQSWSATISQQQRLHTEPRGPGVCSGLTWGPLEGALPQAMFPPVHPLTTTSLPSCLPHSAPVMLALLLLLPQGLGMCCSRRPEGSVFSRPPPPPQSSSAPCNTPSSGGFWNISSLLTVLDSTAFTGAPSLDLTLVRTLSATCSHVLPSLSSWHSVVLRGGCHVDRCLWPSRMQSWTWSSALEPRVWS